MILCDFVFDFVCDFPSTLSRLLISKMSRANRNNGQYRQPFVVSIKFHFDRDEFRPTDRQNRQNTHLFVRFQTANLLFPDTRHTNTHLRITATIFRYSDGFSLTLVQRLYRFYVELEPRGKLASIIYIYFCAMLNRSEWSTRWHEVRMRERGKTKHGTAVTKNWLSLPKILISSSQFLLLTVKYWTDVYYGRKSTGDGLSSTTFFLLLICSRLMRFVSAFR